MVAFVGCVILSKFNIAAEEVKGSLYGKPYNGIVYSASDNNDIKVGNPFPANVIGDFAGVKALEQKYITSKPAMEQGKMLSLLRQHIDTAIKESRTKEELQRNLFANGVGVVFRENAEGRLYGITYIDHTTGATLNGSRLGKAYSANAIEERLNAPRALTTETLQQFVQQHPQYEQQPQQYSSLVSGSTGLFDLPADTADDPEETLFRHRMQQKKKRGRRM